MTLKQFKIVQMVIAIILGITFSQAIVLKNYLIPIAVIIVASLVMLYLKRKVKGVIADERDYLTGGKAALLTIQIYSWVAVVAMFIFYSARDLNPAYEPIGLTLAYSTCILMLAYSVIFRYYDKVKLSDKKFLFTVLTLILFLALFVFSLRLFSGEDDWMCQGGQWVKHGQPSFAAPNVPCK
jgi:uncharacterized membrane protein